MSRTTRIALAALAAVVLTASLALLAWFGLRTSAAPEPMDLQAFLNSMVISAAPPTPQTSGGTIPDVELETLPPYRDAWGDTLRLHRFAGRTPLVVNVWASWCPPCRREAPLLQAAWLEHRDHVQFVGINHRDQEDAALAFIEEFGQTFPSGADPKGEIANAFGLVGVPTTYFIDESGRIQSTKVGEITEEDLARRIQAILAPRAP